MKTMTWHGDRLDLIDQTRLPHEAVQVSCRDAADVAAACAAARAVAARGDRVVVYGSFHTVSAALDSLRLYCAASPLVDRPATWIRV